MQARNQIRAPAEKTYQSSIDEVKASRSRCSLVPIQQFCTDWVMSLRLFFS